MAVAPIRFSHAEPDRRRLPEHLPGEFLGGVEEVSDQNEIVFDAVKYIMVFITVANQSRFEAAGRASDAGNCARSLKMRSKPSA
jgi:hypothetical protein